MSKSSYAVLLLGGALISSIVHSGEVDVRMALVTPDSVEVSYTLPDTCKSVPFRIDEGTETIRASWQSKDACGTADGNVLSRGNKVCKALRLRVPVTTARVSGHYASAFPMGGGAVYVHTSSHAVDESCGKVRCSFAVAGQHGL